MSKIVYVAGSTRPITVNLTDGQGVPFDLTGWSSIKIAIGVDKSSTPDLEETFAAEEVGRLEVTEASGQILFYPTSAESLALAVQSHIMQVWVELASGWITHTYPIILDVRTGYGAPE